MKRIRELLRRLARGQAAQSPPEQREDPADALSDERVLGGSHRR
jgi:hypothetical protein